MWIFGSCVAFILLVTAQSDQNRLIKTDSEAEANACPPWTVYDENQTQCKCVITDFNVYNSLINCVETNGNTPEVFLLLGACITQNKKQTKLMAGFCPYYHLDKVLMQYVSAPQSTSELNKTCKDYYKRAGQFCGQCLSGYSFPAYSYDLSCVRCPPGTNGWGKFLLISLLPTTIFFFVVLVFRFRATSPQLNCYILVAQLMTSPVVLREAFKHSHLNSSHNKYSASLYLGCISIWNLDFFRLIYSPFCLHPQASMLQVLSLDYIVAAYPLSLIIFTYALATLHYRGCPLVLWLWRPFRWCFALLRRQWDIRNSLLDAFATFLLLSYIKFQSVSFDILTPLFSLDVYGTKQQTMLYYDGTVKYFGREHLPYAVLAITVLLVFNLLPIFLLCLYPCPCFQMLLNKFQLNGETLRVFMDIFQGCFKNGTEGTVDCRYFAAFYFMVRVGENVAFSLFGVREMYIMSFFIVLALLIIAVLQPYKTPFFNRLDSVILSSLILGIVTLLQNSAYNSPVVAYFSRIFQYVLLTCGLMYPLCLVLYQVYKKSRRLKAIIQPFFTTLAAKRRNRACVSPLMNVNEATPLISNN